MGKGHRNKKKGRQEIIDNSLVIFDDLTPHTRRGFERMKGEEVPMIGACMWSGAGGSTKFLGQRFIEGGKIHLKNELKRDLFEFLKKSLRKLATHKEAHPQSPDTVSYNCAGALLFGGGSLIVL